MKKLRIDFSDIPDELIFNQPEQAQQVEQPQTDEVAWEQPDPLLAKYGVSATRGNLLTFGELYRRMQQDNLPTEQRALVQKEWIKGIESRLNFTSDKEEKEKLQKVLDSVASSPYLYRPNTVKNQALEAWDKGSSALSAQGEYLVDRTASEVQLSDKKLLEKWNKSFLKELEANGGFDKIYNIAMRAMQNSSEATKFVGFVPVEGSKEEIELGNHLLEKLSQYRILDTMARANPSGAEVENEDGEKRKVSRLQKAIIETNQPSNIVGNLEAQDEFQENPLKPFTHVDGVRYLWGTTLQSTISTAPSFVAGILAGAITRSPIVAKAVMQTANITDQQYQYVVDAITERYKEDKGEDADVSKLKGDEFLTYANKLANEGVISKAVEDGIKTGILMSIGGTVAGEAFGTLGRGISKLAPNKAKKKLVSAILTKASEMGVAVSNEGVQEVAETIIENHRKGKDWTEGLSQAFLLSMVAPENIVTTTGELVEQHRAGKHTKNKENLDTSTESPPENAKSGADTKVEEPSTPTEPAKHVRRVPPEEATKEPPKAEHVPPKEDIKDVISKFGEVDFGDFDLDLSEFEDKPEAKNEPKTEAKPKRKTESKPKQEEFTEGSESEAKAVLEKFRPLYKKYLEDPESLTEAQLSEMKAYEEEFGRLTATTYGEFSVPGSASLAIMQEGKKNDNRATDRASKENASRKADSGGDIKPDAKTEGSPNATRPTVPSDETKTSTERPAEPVEQTTKDSARKSDDNKEKSDTTGASGRTSENNGQPVEQGESGKRGGGENREPESPAHERDTDSGVLEREESGSVGEVLDLKKTISDETNFRKRQKLVHDLIKKHPEHKEEIREVVKDLHPSGQVFEAMERGYNILHKDNDRHKEHLKLPGAKYLDFDGNVLDGGGR